MRTFEIYCASTFQARAGMWAGVLGDLASGAQSRFTCRCPGRDEPLEHASEKGRGGPVCSRPVWSSPHVPTSGLVHAGEPAAGVGPQVGAPQQRGERTPAPRVV